MTIHCSGMWWPPSRSVGGFINSLIFMSSSGLTLYNFLSSMYHGPGYLPLKWKPVRYIFAFHLDKIFSATYDMTLRTQKATVNTCSFVEFAMGTKPHEHIIVANVS